MTPPRGESHFLRHEPCPSCDSRDNLARYSDGHGYCMGCGFYQKGEDDSPTDHTSNRQRPMDLIQGVVKGIAPRQITEATAKHFNYQVGEHRGQRVHIAPYYDDRGHMVAQKIRTKDKGFKVLGSLDTALPFGAQAWPKRGKKIVVTEGEIDALTMSQVQGNKWPVVSIACGAGGQIKKYIAKHREYFHGFDEVVLMFDMDEPGRKAAQEAAAIIGSRARIADLPGGHKDPNEMLLAGKTEALINAMWKAAPWRPDGIVDMASLEADVLKPVEIGLPWFLPTLTSLTYGRRRGELYALGAGTGVGKTDLLTQQIAYDITELGLPVGVFALEQEPKETAKRIAGKLAGKLFHIPDAGWDEADLRAAWEKLQGSGKVFLYNSFGMNDWDSIREKMEYLCHAEGVKDFYLDHLTALAAGEESEREALELIMAELGGLVKQLDCTITFVSHLATPEGKPHEEGGRVTIRHFKGSRAIGFWSHYMIGLERNQQSEDPTERSTTTLRVLKDRYTGRATGELIYLGYDRETGRLYETTKPEEGKSYGFTNEAPVGATGDF